MQGSARERVVKTKMKRKFHDEVRKMRKGVARRKRREYIRQVKSEGLSFNEDGAERGLENDWWGRSSDDKASKSVRRGEGGN